MRYLKLGIRLAIYVTLLISIMNGCTTINIINERLSQLMYVDSAFSAHVDTYIKEAKKRNIRHGSIDRLTMIFGLTGTKEEPNTVGTCANISGFPLIVIDRGYWALSNEDEHEELIMHELGHCLLNRDHCEAKVDGKGSSIMAAEMLGSKIYVPNREKLINELFNPTSECDTR